MLIRTHFRALTLSVVACSIFASSAFAERPDSSSQHDRSINRLVARLQDERSAVPFSAVVTIDPAEALRYRMALASDLRRDRLAKLESAAAADALVSSSRPGGVNFSHMDVSLVEPDLKRRRLKVDDDGFVQISDLKPGMNVIVATGRTAHGVHPVFIKLADSGKNADRKTDDAPVDNQQPDQVAPADDVRLAGNEPRTISLISVSGKQVLSLIDRYVPERSSEPQGSLGDIKTDVETGRDFQQRIQLGGAGTLAGQIISLMVEGAPGDAPANMNIVLWRGGRQVARALTDDRGRFEFTGIEPDVYGIVAAGSGGYAAFSFEAFAAPALVDRSIRNDRGHRFVAAGEAGLAVAEGDVLPVVTVPPPMVPTVIESIQLGYERTARDPGGASTAMAPPAAAPGASPAAGGGGGFGGGGGGFGGGGGGGGGGGLGGLGGIGALGLLGAAAASSSSGSSNFQFPPPMNVASPAVP